MYCNSPESGGWDMGPSSPLSAASPQQATTQQPAVQQVRKQVRIREPVNVWAMLDPYTEGTLQQRPFKAGMIKKADVDVERLG